MTSKDVQQALGQYASDADAAFLQRFFKTDEDGYGAGDQFLGIRVPITRRICREFKDLSLKEIEKLLESPMHEHRLAAVIIMVMQAKSKRTDSSRKKALYDLYLRRTDRINNWDIVDASCRDVVGGYLLDKPRDTLYELARSPDLWERRIAMVSTWEFIRHHDVGDAMAIAALLLDDQEDLIHKASGWMLREAGKRDGAALLDFLNMYAHKMPRTMLRYSIEKLSSEQRRFYMDLKHRRTASS